LVDRLRTQARDLGFDLFGVAPAVTPQGYHRLVDWVDAGYAAGMSYFENRLSAYGDPGMVLAGVRSVIVLSYPYRTAHRADKPVQFGSLEPESTVVRTGATGLSAGATARIASYAWGDADYHDVIHPLLARLKETIRAECPDAESRGVVDTAPLMEREFAQAAGIGWAGKNSLILNKRRGSYFFLACLLTTLDLPADSPHDASHCGTCTRCLDACPTDAFAAPGVVDSRRCISYLTIEHRGPIPTELRPRIGDWMFGCDVCQDVCPWNLRHAKTDRPDESSDGSTADASSRPDRRFWPRDGHNPVDLVAVLSLDDQAFRDAFRSTPLWRPRRRGILRNAAVCAGNSKDPSAAPVLATLLDDAEPLIRGAAAWALGQIGGRDDELRRRLEREDDAQVTEELMAALAATRPRAPDERR
jgi:epoxyqueuosine reductase